MQSTNHWFEKAGVVFLTAVAIAGFAIAIYATWIFHDLPDGSELVNYRPVTSARVFGQDGTLIGEYGQIRRVYVPYDRIPKPVVNAFLAAEDRSFFNHSGVDVSGVSRAFLKNIANFVSGRRLEGGSTITQQVTKNLLLKTNERTLGRKLKELILARRLEQSLTKEQIIELYLNDIFLGFRSYGVGAASFNYFGKSIDSLSLSEMAYLASLPKAPKNYHPVHKKEAAIQRRNWVLGEMLRAKWITREQAVAASKEDLIAQEKPLRAKYHDADYFVDAVEQRSKEIFKDKLYSEGFYIKSTLDPRLQSMALSALMNGLEKYDRRHGWRGALIKDTSLDNWLLKLSSYPIAFERRNWVHARIMSASKGSVSLELSDGRNGNLAAEDVAWANAGKGLKVGDIVLVSYENNQFRLKQTPEVNGAIVVLDPFSGRVVALVGGYSFSLHKYNRATMAKRQPGSSIKPFVYAAALEKDFTPASIVDDSALSFTGGDGKEWAPKNYDGTFMGPQLIRRGIELSRNLMTVRIADAVGISNITNRLMDYGVAKKVPNELSSVLGAGEVSPFDLANAYALFVNGGRRVTPHIIDQVIDRNGVVVFREDKRACPAACKLPYDGLESPKVQQIGEQVMDPIVAYQVNSFMQGAIQRGTGVAARSLNRPVGGKTGTTNNYRSAWFAGFTPDLVVTVFVGFDDNRSLGDKETGSAAALPIFIDFIGKAYANKPVKEFTKPRDAIYVTIRGIEEAFKVGTEPGHNTGQATPDAPLPYDELWKEEAPPQEALKPAPTAPKKTLEDAADLY